VHWGRRAADREERLARLQAQLSRVEERLQTLSHAVERQHEEQRAAAERLEVQLERDVRPLLLALARDDAGNRRRLFAVRDSPEYSLAYTEPEPLVSVVIPATAKRVELLVERALPSALNQTYGNVEVIVVGDAAGPEWRAAVGRIKDPRIRCSDLTQRFVHPDPQRHWMTGSTVARNEAHRLVRGRWIAELDDDDALRPRAVASLLRMARAESLEVAYGIMERHDVNGETEPLGRFPPAPQEPQLAPAGPAPSTLGRHGRVRLAGARRTAHLRP
jgi:Glycosyl transferase family 2